MESNFRFIEQNKSLNFELNKFKAIDEDGDLMGRLKDAHQENQVLRESAKADFQKIKNQQKLIDQ